MTVVKQTLLGVELCLLHRRVIGLAIGWARRLEAVDDARPGLGAVGLLLLLRARHGVRERARGLEVANVRGI